MMRHFSKKISLAFIFIAAKIREALHGREKLKDWSDSHWTQFMQILKVSVHPSLTLNFYSAVLQDFDVLHGQTGFSPHSPMIYRALKVDVCLSWGRLPRAEVKTSLVRTSFSELAGVDAQLTVNQRWHQLNCPGLRLLPCGAGRFVHRWPPVTHIRTLTVSSWSPVNHRATLDCSRPSTARWLSIMDDHH